MRRITFVKKMTSLFVLPYLVGGCGSSTSIQAKVRTQKVEAPAPEDQLQDEEKQVFALLGQGSNSFNGGVAVGRCILGDLPSSNVLGKEYETPEYAGDGQTIEFKHSEVSSTEELRKKTEMSLDVKGSSGLYSGKVKASFLESQEINQEDINIFYHVKVVNPEVKMSNVRLSPEALELLEKQGLPALYKRCGDEAIIGYQTGGELLSMIQISKRDKTNTSSMAVAAEASGVKFSVNGKIIVDESNKKNDLKVDVSGKYIGGKAEIIKTGVTEFRDQAEGWAKVVAQHGVVLNLVKIKYSELAAGALDPQLVKMQDFMNDLDKKYDLLGDYVEQINNEMGHVSDLQLKDRYSRAKADATKLKGEIIDKLTACKNLLDVEHCIDIQLTEKVDLFGTNFFEKRADPSCGVATWKEIQNAACGLHDKDVAKTNDPVCGVELYNQRNERKCREYYSGCRKDAPECPPKTACEDNYVRRPEYGVEKYKDCSVKEPEANTCRFEGGEPETFKECVLIKPKT